MLNEKAGKCHLSLLIGFRVIDHETSKFIGYVTEIWVDLNNHKVLGFNCRARFWDVIPQTYALNQICVIGGHYISVTKSATAIHLILMRELEPKAFISANKQLNCCVRTENGHYVGNIFDCNFELYSGKIDSYSCTKNSQNGLTRKQFNIPKYKVLYTDPGCLVISNLGMQSLDSEGEAAVA